MYICNLLSGSRLHTCTSSRQIPNPITIIIVYVYVSHKPFPESAIPYHTIPYHTIPYHTIPYQPAN